MIATVLGIIFLSVSAASKAVMDTIQFHYYSSKLDKGYDPFWYPELSWKNKYKNLDPQQGPRFFGSTTILAWTTDAWHLFQMAFLKFMFVGVALIVYGSTSIPLALILSMILFGVVFELFYSDIFRS